MKIALVYDRVNKWGGAERVLLALHELFPEAPIYTSVYSPNDAKWADVFSKVIPSFLQNILLAKNNHEKIPFLMPIAFESFDFSNYDLVISVTSEAAKGIITKPTTKHICYCLTPTRYLWSGHKDYLDTSFKRTVTRPLVSYLRKWDNIAANRPDMIIAISTEVKTRINKYYNRDSEIIFPPSSFTLSTDYELPFTDYYLLVSRLVQYKKVDIAIKTFNKLKKPLVVVGSGNQANKLKKIAKNNITFVGNVPDEELSSYYANSKALIMPQHEDFGLVAVEAQLHGTPVIAYGKGGSVDTVKNGQTGILFKHQTVQSLSKAINEFEKMNWNQDTIKNNAERFSKERFKKEFMGIINKINK